MKKIYFAIMIIVFSLSGLRAQEGKMMQNHKKININFYQIVKI